MGEVNELLYLGTWYRTVVEVYPKRRIQVLLAEDSIIIRLPDTGITVKELSEALVDWYKEQARMVCGEKLHHFSRIMGLTLLGYRIKEQKTRWGSCSTLQNININWRIMLAPEQVVDYLIVHELAHLRQMNHSNAFWQEVAKVLPQYDREKKWLRINGHRLMSYRPAGV